MMCVCSCLLITETWMLYEVRVVGSLHASTPVGCAVVVGSLHASTPVGCAVVVGSLHASTPVGCAVVVHCIGHCLPPD